MNRHSENMLVGIPGTKTEQKPSKGLELEYTTKGRNLLDQYTLYTQPGNNQSIEETKSNTESGNAVNKYEQIDYTEFEDPQEVAEDNYYWYKLEGKLHNETV